QAPEIFTTRQYTAKADVYAYGITIWEIFHNAKIPYPGIENKIIRQKIFDPEFRPAIDGSVPTTWRHLMKACWKADPDKRPPMLGIVGYLRRERSKRGLENPIQKEILKKTYFNCVYSDTVKKKKRNEFNEKEVSDKEGRDIRLNEITAWPITNAFPKLQCTSLLYTEIIIRTCLPEKLDKECDFLMKNLDFPNVLS
ncbi:hypothetical protein ANCCAN_10651, partial [Ancylostoma caninum]